MNPTQKQLSLIRAASKKQMPISQWKLAPPKHVPIELCGALDVARVQHQMAEFLDFHAVSLLAFFAIASFASPARAATIVWPSEPIPAIETAHSPNAEDF